MIFWRDCMVKKLKKTDILFAIALLSCLFVHIFFLFLVPFSEDESFYATIPFRLMNGDSLIQHEWHLSQFSSLFSYIPICIWKNFKGSAEGMFIFLRCVYLSIHTIIAVTIYSFFKKYGKWAILASMMFYVQISYRIIAISYHSMFVIFLLLLSFCLLSIYQNYSIRFYIFAGICFGCCCVCNPLFCLAFALYLFVCALWTKREAILNTVIKNKVSGTVKKEKKLTKRQKREQKQEKQRLLDSFPNMENYTCFFTKEAIFWISCGILIIAVVAVVFFLSTGGTLRSVQGNIENLLGSSEYNIASQSIFSKLKDTLHYFTLANLGMPWILPLLFVVLFFDEKKRSNSHRIVYLSVSLLWSILFVIGIIINMEVYLCAFSLPFCVFSTVCYMLTENKNKPLFYFMYLPCLIATCSQYLAADTHLAVIGIVLVVNNVAGVFFAMDLFKEMCSASKTDSESTDGKGKAGLYRTIIIIGFCLQIIFYCIFYLYGQVPMDNPTKATSGPYAGLYMSETEYNHYNKAVNDLDVIKNLSKEDDPVLIVSYGNWMYLHLERPIATYTTWYRGALDFNQLVNYYKENPENMPKYIYIDSPDTQNQMVLTYMNLLGEMFEFTREDLSNGVLLIVE